MSIYSKLFTKFLLKGRQHVIKFTKKIQKSKSNLALSISRMSALWVEYSDNASTFYMCWEL